MEIEFKFLLRNPKYPVIAIDKDNIFSCFNKKQLASVLYHFTVPEDDHYSIIIDSSGEEFCYDHEHNMILPGFLRKRWTKKRIIELYNKHCQNGEFYNKNYSNIKLSQIVNEICELLK